MNYQIFHEHLSTYNEAIKDSRQSHFSKLIADNQNNLKILFTTIDHLINPVFMKSSSESSISKCEDFADHFRSKIDDIRSLLSKDQNLNFITTEHLFLHEDTLEKFVLVDAEMLAKVSSQLKPATCIFKSHSDFLF